MILLRTACIIGSKGAAARHMPSVLIYPPMIDACIYFSSERSWLPKAPKVRVPRGRGLFLTSSSQWFPRTTTYRCRSRHFERLIRVRPIYSRVERAKEELCLFSDKE